MAIYQKSKTFQEENQKLFNDYSEKVLSLTEKVYQENIVPFCKKNNFRFFSGMGTWTFKSNKTNQLVE